MYVTRSTSSMGTNWKSKLKFVSVRVDRGSEIEFWTFSRPAVIFAMQLPVLGRIVSPRKLSAEGTTATALLLEATHGASTQFWKPK